MEVLGKYFADRFIEKLTLSDCVCTPGNVIEKSCMTIILSTKT